MSKKEKKELELAIAAAESDHLRKSRKKMSARDFVNVKLIGRGAFGEVCVFLNFFLFEPILSYCRPLHPDAPLPQVRVVSVRSEKGDPTERVYAMKIMNKDFMIQKNQVRIPHSASLTPLSSLMLVLSVTPWWNMIMMELSSSIGPSRTSASSTSSWNTCRVRLLSGSPRDHLAFLSLTALAMSPHLPQVVI